MASAYCLFRNRTCPCYQDAFCASLRIVPQADLAAMANHRPAPDPVCALLLHPNDNVVVALRRLPAGQGWTGSPGIVRALQEILPAHKMAIRHIPSGAPILKYGHPIGIALEAIQTGQHVHTHNMKMPDAPPRLPTLNPTESSLSEVSGSSQPPRCFQGYARADGRVGTRNYLAIVPSVHCSVSVSSLIADRFDPRALAREFPHVDGILALRHNSGCGLTSGDPLRQLQRTLAGLAHHPNIAGCLFIGLGCEVNQADALARLAGTTSSPGAASFGVPPHLNIQNLGGVRKTVEAGVAAVRRLLPLAEACHRTPQPLGKLVVALKCGGSDAWSGITANPALGVAVDKLVSQGGTAVLAETPEIFGAEHLLIHRAAQPEIASALLERIAWWTEHLREFGASVDNNPSPGNKEGGLTTIYEKSLGAVAKAGLSPLRAVYRYAEPVRELGLCFMDTPGFDPVSMTGLIAGGCNLSVFTTGRGSVFGGKPVPCLKVASNTELFDRMSGDLDLNAGTILAGLETVAQVGNRIFEQIIATASGQQTRAEIAGLGNDDFVPWVLGPVL
ncbi:MAG TPA: altronate dehydratase family protein [Candidatus Paceibacterota bacterium]|nr:altronate dehydratase family protein [Candidatus Paceibacterota bacterium]